MIFDHSTKFKIKFSLHHVKGLKQGILIHPKNVPRTSSLLNPLLYIGQSLQKIQVIKAEGCQGYKIHLLPKNYVV